MNKMLEDSSRWWEPVQPIFFLMGLEQNIARAKKNGKKSKLQLFTVKLELEVTKGMIATQELLSREQPCSSRATLDSNLQDLRKVYTQAGLYEFRHRFLMLKMLSSELSCIS